MIKLFKFLVLITLIIGCSSDDGESVNVSNKTLSGKVFGESFTAKGGKAFNSGDKIAVNITNVQADCNSSVFNYMYSISTYIEKKTGVSKNANVVFKKKGNAGGPLNVLGSIVMVESISANQIVLKIKSKSGSDNTIEGKFTVPFCD